MQPFWKTVWRFLKKLEIELTYDPAIALLGIYPKNTKMLVQRGKCTPMFIAVPSIIAKVGCLGGSVGYASGFGSGHDLMV